MSHAHVNTPPSIRPGCCWTHTSDDILLTQDLSLSRSAPVVGAAGIRLRELFATLGAKAGFIGGSTASMSPPRRGYSGSRNRRAHKTRAIPIEHPHAQVARVTRRQPVCESSRRVGRLRGHRLAGARTRTHSRRNDHLWRATGRGSAAGPPRPRHQPAFDSAEANPLDTQTLKDF